LHEDVRNISATAEKLLQLAKIHSDAENVVFSDVRLDELLYQTRDALLKTNPEYTIRVEIRALPESEEQACALGNEALLRLALLNLFDNGCKYSPDHTVNARIFFDDSGKAYIDVRNAGDGIPQSDLPHIFKPFYRSYRHIALKGSGIGLSLVYSILKLHHIDIQVHSQPGEGVHFRLIFPGRDIKIIPSRLPVLSDYSQRNLEQ
jgi:signal transduction histidine kinase